MILQSGQSFSLKVPAFRDTVDLNNDYFQGICGEKIMIFESEFEFLSIKTGEHPVHDEFSITFDN